MLWQGALQCFVQLYDFVEGGGDAVGVDVQAGLDAHEIFAMGAHAGDLGFQTIAVFGKTDGMVEVFGLALEEMIAGLMFQDGGGVAQQVVFRGASNRDEAPGPGGAFAAFELFEQPDRGGLSEAGGGIDIVVELVHLVEGIAQDDVGGDIEVQGFCVAGWAAKKFETAVDEEIVWLDGAAEKNIGVEEGDGVVVALGQGVQFGDLLGDPAGDPAAVQPLAGQPAGSGFAAAVFNATGQKVACTEHFQVGLAGKAVLELEVVFGVDDSDVGDIGGKEPERTPQERELLDVAGIAGGDDTEGGAQGVLPQ